jgi:hypothetical protein
LHDKKGRATHFGLTTRKTAARATNEQVLLGLLELLDMGCPFGSLNSRR